jgi:peptidyl-prolyl cis-trans isomerase SurA
VLGTANHPWLKGSAVLLAAALPLLTAGCHPAPGPDVMATVNGKPILRAELDRNYQNSGGDSQKPTLKEQEEINRLQILRQMIDDEILQQRAAKLNLAATDDDVNAKLTEFKAPYTQEEFDKQLKDHNLTLDDLKTEFRKTLTKNKLLNKEIDSKINVTDAEINNYYTAHKAEFNLIEPQYHLAQIMVTSVPTQQQTTNLQNNKAGSDAEAKRKIEALHNQLVNGEDFGAVAMNFSENGYASNGGDMGFIPESQLKSDQSVFNAIGKLKSGEITDVIQMYSMDQTGHRVVVYSIFKLLSHEAAGQREMNDPRVRQIIRQLLHDARTQLLKNAYLEMLHDQAQVHNYYSEQLMKDGAQ